MNNSGNNQPKLISIIIATSNCGRKIEKTLESIFAQNNELFEVIIFDNASTDETLKSIEKFKDRLTLVSEKDNGVYYAFNKGLEMASGQYMYFIGAGDCLRPEVFDQIRPFLVQDKPRFFYGECFLMKMKLLQSRKFEARTFICNNICHQGIFYHREIFQILGKYNLKYLICADWFLNLQCFLEQNIEKKFYPITIADYEQGGLSEDLSRDPAFQKDFPAFVRKRFGFKSYIFCWAFVNHQPAYLKCYDAIGYIISVLRPSVRRFRKLKNRLKKD